MTSLTVSADGMPAVPQSEVAKILHRSTQAETASSASCMASIHTSSQQPGSGLWVHPAVLDSTLHIGAALGLAADGSASEVRVPTAFAAYHMADRMSDSDAWASCGGLAMSSDGELSSSYKLAARGICCASMAGLVAKPSKISTQAAAAGIAETDLLYTLQWTAAEAATAASRRSQRAAAVWDRAGQQVTLLRSSDQEQVSASRALQAMQQAAAQDSPMVSGLLTRGAIPVPAAPRSPCATPSQQILAAMLRTAAQEHPRHSWQHVDSSPLAASGSVRSSAHLDAHGVTQLGRISYLPRMLPEDPASSPVLHERTCSPGGTVFISGASGDIGTLLAAWAAIDQPSAALCLASRMGYLSTALLQSSTALVTSVRCDVAASEETAAAFRTGIHPGSAVSQLLHTAGVLSDALMVHQRARGLREALAPKVSGVERLHVASGLLALQPAMLFSSTAALFGPAGQAAYAAANAGLNGWADQQQSQGA